MAEAVYRNGRIYTLDPKSSVISAVAVMDCKFFAVGGEADVKPFIGPKTQVIDLGGKPVIPGLNDTHNHTMQAGETAVRVKLDDVKSVAEALQRIKDATAKKKPGEWIIGDSWHPTAQLKEQRYLTAAEIDTVAPNNPVRLGDGHISSYNTAAMKIGGVDRNTRNPEGGVIDKDASGNPNGIFEEKARRPDLSAHPAADRGGDGGTVRQRNEGGQCLWPDERHRPRLKPQAGARPAAADAGAQADPALLGHVQPAADRARREMGRGN